MAIYVPIVMRLFIVSQELHCLQICNFLIPWSLWVSISFVSQLSLVMEIRWSKLKKKNNNNDNNKEKKKSSENEH